MMTGERPIILLGSAVRRKIHVPGGFWATTECGLVPVDLVTCRGLADDLAGATPIIDTKIEGQYHLRVRTPTQDEPLSISGSEPRLVHHERFGPCVVIPQSMS
jgi:hypothetical protein